MANTLYDLLEVSATASPESIAASHQRLRAHFLAQQAAGDEDATNRLIALREAFATLSDTVRRQAYDDRLAARAAGEPMAEEPPRSFAKILIGVALIGACGFGYAKYQANQEQKMALEKEKAAAAVRLAEIEAQRERERAERELREARQAEYQRSREEARERAERERDLAYGRQISRDIQRGEAMALREKQREEQREAQQRQREEQQRHYEAERRLAQEKAALRRMEAENARYPRY